MLTMILKRAAMALPSLIGVVIVTFLLTRVLDELPDPSTVRLLPAREIYPIDFRRAHDGTLFDFRCWEIRYQVQFRVLAVVSWPAKNK